MKTLLNDIDFPKTNWDLLEIEYEKYVLKEKI